MRKQRTLQPKESGTPEPVWRPLTPEHELLNCPVFSVVAVEKERILGGPRATFFNLKAPMWVNIVATTIDDNLILIRQYRHGINDYVLELPAGMVTEGEDPAVTAKRELLEETGFEGRDVGLLGRLLPNPGLQNNECLTYCFEHCSQIRPPTPEAFEDLVVQVIAIDTLDALITSGEFRNALSVAAIQIFQASRRSRQGNIGK